MKKVLLSLGILAVTISSASPQKTPRTKEKSYKGAANAAPTFLTKSKTQEREKNKKKVEYQFRNIKNPPIKISEKSRILQVGPGRTGSTLVANVLHYLFEDSSPELPLLWSSTSEKQIEKFVCSGAKVFKSHFPRFIDMLEEKGFNTYVVATIRNPLESVASHYKTFGNKSKEEKEIKRITQWEKKRFMELYQKASKANNNQFIILRFEDFGHGNFEHIFDSFEKLFGISIPSEHKEKMKKFFSINEMKKISDKVQKGHPDPATGLYPNHISSKTNWKNIIPEECHLYVLEEMAEAIEKWGYRKEAKL
jgi:hypothetical protein